MSHAAAANLNAVQNDIISLGADLGKFLRLKQRHVLRFGTSEWMMHRVPFVVLGTPFKEREICDPKKIPVRRASFDFAQDRLRSRLTMQILHLCDAQA